MPLETFSQAAQETRQKIKSLPLQLKYSMYLTLATGLTSLVMIFVMAWFIQRNYNLFLGDELGVSAQVVQIVRHEQRLLEIWLFLLFLFSITLMFAVTFFITRKLIQPLAAIERQLRLYVRGDWNHSLRLSNDDEFKELERLMNQLRTNHLENNRMKAEPA